MTLPPFSSTCLRAQSSAINVLPEAVGLARTMFLPSSTPASMQSCWGGNNSDIPKPRSTSLTDSGTDNSAIFKVFAINFVVDSMGLGGLLEFFCNLKAFFLSITVLIRPKKEIRLRGRIDSLCLHLSSVLCNVKLLWESQYDMFGTEYLELFLVHWLSVLFAFVETCSYSVMSC